MLSFAEADPDTGDAAGDADAVAVALEEDDRCATDTGTPGNSRSR